jgi:hypothetical protein
MDQQGAGMLSLARRQKSGVRKKTAYSAIAKLLDTSEQAIQISIVLPFHDITSNEGGCYDNQHGRDHKRYVDGQRAEQLKAMQQRANRINKGLGDHIHDIEHRVIVINGQPGQNGTQQHRHVQKIQECTQNTQKNTDCDHKKLLCQTYVKKGGGFT